jgi:hypothetical protein
MAWIKAILNRRKSGPKPPHSCGARSQAVSNRLPPTFDLDGPIPGSAAGWSIDTFAQQLGGQVARESGNTGTIVCLTMPSGEASSDRRVRGSRVLERPW